MVKKHSKMKESGLSGPSSWMHHIATVCRYCGVVLIVWGGGGVEV